VKNAIPIEGRTDVSFLEFALEGLEYYHSTLGRYDFPDQYPIVSDASLPSPVKRAVPQSTIAKVNISTGDDIINFYVSSLKDLCEPGEDPSTYGETVYCDSDLIQLLNERVNLGRYVAESKLQRNPSIVEAIDDEQLISRLRDTEREEKVVMKAKDIAVRYGLNPDVTEKYFRWIIGKTIEVEVEYIKKRKSDFPKNFS
jgi:chorismate mutase